MSKFWKATSVNAANGSAIVTVNTGDDVALIRANSLLQIGALQVVEVKTVNTSNQTIELFDAWNGGSISGQSAIAAPSAAELAQAIDDVRTLTAAYEGIADDVSVNPTANSIVKRTSAGRVKTATPSAADDAVNLGYLGTAATRTVGTSTGNVMEVGAFDFGVSGNATTFNTSPSDTTQLPTRFGRGQLPDSTFTTFLNMRANNNRQSQIHVSYGGDTRVVVRSMGQNDVWNDDVELYHSGNTNFTKIGNGSSDIALQAFGLTSSSVVIFVPTHKNTPANSVSTSINFEVQSVDGGATVGTNKTLTMGNSSGFLTTLTIEGLSGITYGTVYRVVGGSATINF